MRKYLRRPTPATAISMIALFVALGGTGYAAATGSIDGREIKNNTVQGKDVRNSSLTGSDVRNSSLTGSDVRNNSLTGSDVSESTLGKVPSSSRADTATNAGSAAFAGAAASAGNANTVNGVTLAKLRFEGAANAAEATIATIGNVTVKASCDAEGQPKVTAVSTAAHWQTVRHLIDTADAVSGTGSADLQGTTTPHTLVQDEDFARVMSTISEKGGLSYEFNFSVREATAYDTNVCVVSGFVTAG